ncbi:uncharacterized protein LOC144562405 [Carex rostrata]
MSEEAVQQAPTREWSELPDLPLATIARLLLPTLRDLFSFASVCRSWRSLLLSLSPSLLPSLPPLLLTASFRLLNPSLPFSSSPLTLPSSNSYRYRYLSFSHGHLLLLPSSPPLHPLLDNVITGSRIILPPLPSDYHSISYNYATLTAPPSSPSSLFLLFFSKFAFLSCHVSSPGATWTRHRFSPDISFITHVVPFRNRLFGLNDQARLLELHLSDQTHAVRFANVLRLPHAPHDIDRWHFGPQLVCTSDQLLLVLFLFSKGINASFQVPLGSRVEKIEVYSLDWRRMEWVNVKRLQDSAIFIDCAGKVPVLCEKPERWGGESNSVYVAGPGYGRWKRFSLDEKADVPMLFPFSDKPARWPSPIWIHPSLFY